MVCVDGLSPIDVLKMKQLFLFPGANIKFDNCGGDHEYVAFRLASDTMLSKYNEPKLTP